MRKVIMYECFICKEIYKSEREANTCESRGKEKPVVTVGRDVDYEVEMGGGFSSFYIPLRVKSIDDKGHYLIYYFEEYDEESGEWGECSYRSGEIYGNEKFEKLCTIK